jgi:hypothetical protein
MQLVIEGFKSEADAQAFISWYSNQGEQDFGDALYHDDDTQMTSANYKSCHEDPSGERLTLIIDAQYD